jgi:murein DD-endopeptidase MepM/ murein hydrolase activator NlpD
MNKLHFIFFLFIVASSLRAEDMLSSIPSVYPVDGWIASEYGSRVSPFTGESAWHPGLDIAAAIGTPIYAPADGTVIFSGTEAGYGNLIIISHGNGIVTRYGHNAKNFVDVGQHVQRGEQIGTVGRTGKVTGAHCHYEVLVSNTHVNPKKFILNY